MPAASYAVQLTGFGPIANVLPEEEMVIVGAGQDLAGRDDARACADVVATVLEGVRRAVVDLTVELDAVAVDDRDHVIHFMKTAEHGGFPDLPFLGFPVPDQDVGA